MKLLSDVVALQEHDGTASKRVWMSEVLTSQAYKAGMTGPVVPFATKPSPNLKLGTGQGYECVAMLQW